MKRLTRLLAVWLLTGFLTYPAEAGPGDEKGSILQLAGITIEDGMVELSVSIAELFDWESIKFVSGHFWKGRFLVNWFDWQDFFENRL